LTPGATADPILLVEDDEAQATLVERVLRKARLDNPLHVMADTREALEYLEGRRANGDLTRALPVLVLLDMRLPSGTGLQILEWIRGSAHVAHLPVVVMSASSDSDDIRQAFALGADTYLVKPVAFDALVAAVSDLGLRWAIMAREVDHD
jgi:CheY-like chemotaxis protein